MKSKNIFIGTVKKCKNLYCYKQYGDEKYFGDFRIGSTEIGTIHRYTDIIDEKAILIKVNEEKYIWIDLLTKADEVLVNLGIPINIIKTFPTCDGALFVDKKTLKPYFENNINNNLNIKKIKSLKSS